MTRVEKLRARMREIQIDAVFVLDEINQRYLSDFSFSDGAVFVTMNKAHLLTDFRYYEMAIGQVSEEFTVSMTKNRTEYIKSSIAEENIKRVGFIGDSVSYERYVEITSKYDSVEFVDIGNTLDVIRQIKSADEIENMQKAQDIADAAFAHLMKMIKTDMTELDVAVELEYAMRKNGAEGVSFDTIAVSGDASSLPHGKPRNVKLRSGFLTMDFGAKYNGYCSDMTRTVVVGRADSDMKKLYNTVLRAHLEAMAYLKDGADAGEADKIARTIIDSYPEYQGTFGHSLGHSVGLLVHETPGLSPKAFGVKLVKDQVVTVEPGIYLFGKYGCRIEDMVRISENGIVSFAHSPKDMIEI